MLIGDAPNQVPTNGDLGDLAFKDLLALNELYSVNIANPQDGQTLTFEAATSTWKNKTIVSKWVYKNATYNPALVGDAILADTSGGAFTITLPASPATNDYIAVADYAGTFATNNLTINSNSLKIMGSVQTLILNVNYRNVTLVYSGATQGWVIVF